MEAFDDGIVAHLDVKEGDDIALGQRVLVLAKKGEDPKQVAGVSWGAEVRGRRQRQAGGDARAPSAGHAAPANGQESHGGRGRAEAVRGGRRRSSGPGQVEPAGPEDRGGREGRPRPGHGDAAPAAG